MPEESGRGDKHVLAETQVAGFGMANGKVVERLRIEFDRETPAAKLVHARLDYAEPLRDRDPNLETLGEIIANPHDSHRDGEQKLEIGSSYGKDRVIVDYHEHAPRVYIRHEHFDNGEWNEAAAWELHPATGIEEVGGDLVTDGGQPENTTVKPGQTWTCNEHNADSSEVPPAHDSVSLWPDYPRFNAIVDDVHGDVAALVVGSSNSHPRAPDLGDRVDVHVRKLRERPEWSVKTDVEGRQKERLVADGGEEVGRVTNHEKGNRNETEARNLLARVYGKGNVDKVDAASNSDPLGFLDILAAKDPFPVRFVQVKTNTFELKDRERYASKAARYPESVVVEVWVRVDYEGWNCYRFDRDSESWGRFLSMDTCDTEETAEALRDALDFYEVIGRGA